MDRSQPQSSNLMDTHNRLVADILTRYRTLMMLATVQAEGERNNATPEAMSVAGISMKMEFDGLYSSIKDLLALSRRIKELWVFGPLSKADPDRVAKEAQIERDVASVAELINGLEGADMRALAEQHGGTWERLTKDDPQAAGGAAAGTAQ
ncbi:surfeit locus protein 5 subunit 22 of mediator complex domain-containing protein [Purpureocillium lavendulum]|uniref:Surfeit locus protein 5 subunit 22 of mediator complex domain-containing protein n=1 Tax=Purpureocillium lavendulum TaxID=1247861 RepID=A0AB34G5Q8_9HYPO|nr:surfeit locus protein 5 subunit 22 of mediator complex domain-containing protein [Purpureocillium lavendulum]